MMRACLSILLVLASAACESVRYDHVDVYLVDGHPEASLSQGELWVPEGGVLVFEAQPRAQQPSAPYQGLERFELRAVQPQVAEVRRAILRDTWVVSGISVGHAELQVIVDDGVVDELSVQVLAPGEEAAP